VHGTYEEIENRPALRFERRIAHPIEDVWGAVTEPDELADWFPARVTIDELRPGARLTFAFPGDAIPPSDGEITECDPPRLLAFDWGEERLRFELEPVDGRTTLLRFTHVLTARDQAARDAAGWHVCLGLLEQRLAGEDTEAPGTEQTPEHKQLYDDYERRGLPTGAPMPG
jgi:uncharacterized protein YndB with AHSA1/START domain